MCTEFIKCHQDLNNLVADGCNTIASMYYVFILNKQWIPNTKFNTVGLGCDLLLYRVTYAFPNPKRFYQYHYAWYIILI